MDIRNPEREMQLLSFLHELENFQYAIQSFDHIWTVLFPSADEKWHILQVVEYKESYFFSDISGNAGVFEFKKQEPIKSLDHFGNPDLEAWGALIHSAGVWMKRAAKDWIAANKRVMREFPLELRKGIAPHAVIRSAFPDGYRLDKELGPDITGAIVSLVEERVLDRDASIRVDRMTANKYFNYCRIAYIAGQREDEGIDTALSGREMYQRFADGRDDGLLKIDGDSEDEFADWIDHNHPLRGVGGHPWEIKRGGNTTHIDLSVRRPDYGRNEKFIVELRGESLGRMAETLRMLYALHEAGLTSTIANPDSVRKRLLAEDNVGIIPSYYHYHRANQQYRRDEDVFEVMYYRELGRYKRRVTPFITWEPLPVLRPIER